MVHNSATPHIEVDLGVMDRDARRMRGERPFVFASTRGEGVGSVAGFVERVGGLAAT